MTNSNQIFKRIIDGEIITEADFGNLNGSASIARRLYQAKSKGQPDDELAKILVDAKLSGDDIKGIFGMGNAPGDDDANTLFTAKYITPIFNVSDALKPLPPITWAIEDMIEFGSVMGIFGAPGSKKTYAMLALGMCAAQGKPWLGRATTQCRVLWIDEDMGRTLFMRRFGDVTRGYDANATTPFEVLSLAGIDIREDQGAIDFERVIRERQARMVFIDTLADATGGAKIVSPDEMQPVLRTLRGIAERTKALIVFIHHANKLGEYLGAVNIAGKVDLLLGVSSGENTPIIKFESKKVRSTGALRFAAKACFYPDSGKFWLDEVDVEDLDKAQKIATMTGASAHVYQYLTDNGPARILQMVDELNTKTSIRQAITRLTKDEIITKSGENISTKEGIYAIKK